jgi:predicted DNA-binding protein (MmcQ/YjbR family)
MMLCLGTGGLNARPTPKPRPFSVSDFQKTLPVDLQSNTSVVAIGFTLGNVRNNLNPGLAEDLKKTFGTAYRGYHARSNRHIVVLSADDESPNRVRNLIQKSYPKAVLSEISQSEFLKIADSIK